MGNGVGSLFNNAHHLTRLLKGRDPSVLPEFPKPGTGPGIQDRQNMYVKKRKWDKARTREYQAQRHGAFVCVWKQVTGTQANDRDYWKRRLERKFGVKL